LLAKVTNRTLWVDWEDRAYGEQNGNLFPRVFRLSGIAVVDHCPAGVDVAPPIWAGKLETSQDQLRAEDLHSRGVRWEGAAPPWDPLEAMRRYSWDVADLTTAADVVVVTTLLLAGPAISALLRAAVVPPGSDAESVLQQCLRDHLRTSDSVGAEIARYRQVHQWEHRTVIGIHVRHTTESAHARTMPAMPDYFKAVDRALAKYADGGIFLSTDHQEVVGLFRSRYGSERIMTTDKWFAEPGQSLHKNPHCPDGIRSAQDAIVDMGLLSCCDFLITLGNSSFSIVANALSISDPNDRIILYPQVSFWERALGRIRRAAHG